MLVELFVKGFEKFLKGLECFLLEVVVVGNFILYNFKECVFFLFGMIIIYFIWEGVLFVEDVEVFDMDVEKYCDCLVNIF